MLGVESIPHEEPPIPEELRLDAPLAMVEEPRRPRVLIRFADFPQRLRLLSAGLSVLAWQ
jgi:hypothetical protein